MWLNLRPGLADPSCIVLVAGHAGAAPSNLRPFEQLLPQDWSVFALALPGRDRRIAEPPDWQFGPISQQAAVSALELVDEAGHAGKPLVVVGQCLGGWLAYAMLAAAGPALQDRCRALVLLSQSPWHSPRADGILPEDPDAMWAQLVATGDVPAPIAEDEEFRELLEPVMRADYTAMRDFPGEAEPLSCPLLAVGGNRDPDAVHLDLPDWARYGSELTVVWIDAGHLPLQDAPGLVAALVSDVELARDTGTHESSRTE